MMVFSSGESNYSYNEGDVDDVENVTDTGTDLRRGTRVRAAPDRYGFELWPD